MRNSRWLRLLAYATGSVNQELLLRNEYLAAENRILRAKLPSRLRLSNPERTTLAESGKRLGRKALREVACVAKPETILAWYRRLVAQKFDGSKHRQYPGRPPVSSEVEALVVKMARENSGWGYDRIVGALATFRRKISVSEQPGRLPKLIGDAAVVLSGPRPRGSMPVPPGHYPC
jgi:putative transposase